MATGNFKRQYHTVIVAWQEEDFEDNEWEIEDEINNINVRLEYFKIELLSGYYGGVQLDITLMYKEECNYDSEEDVQYYFDTTVTELKKNIELELGTINEFIEQLVTETCAVKLNVIGTASNGETFYEEVE